MKRGGEGGKGEEEDRKRRVRDEGGKLEEGEREEGKEVKVTILSFKTFLGG